MFESLQPSIYVGLINPPTNLFFYLEFWILIDSLKVLVFVQLDNKYHILEILIDIENSIKKQIVGCQMN